MTIKTTGSLTFSEIVAEFGGTVPHGLGEYYKGGALVPSGVTDPNTIPSSGAITFNDFYGAADAAPVTFTPELSTENPPAAPIFTNTSVTLNGLGWVVNALNTYPVGAGSKRSGFEGLIGTGPAFMALCSAANTGDRDGILYWGFDATSAAFRNGILNYGGSPSVVAFPGQPGLFPGANYNAVYADSFSGNACVYINIRDMYGTGSPSTAGAIGVAWPERTS